MADSRLYRVGDFENYNISVPIPNAAMEQFLVSARCKEAVLDIANEVYRAYVNLLPASQGDPRVPGSGKRNLKSGARIGARIDSRNGTPRQTAWVLNKAVAYRPTVGGKYPRAIEYGNPANGAAGGYHLNRAAAIVANGKVQAAARAAFGGLSGAGTQMGQARPAPRPVPRKTQAQIDFERQEALRNKNMNELLAKERADNAAEKAKRGGGRRPKKQN